MLNTILTPIACAVLVAYSMYYIYQIITLVKFHFGISRSTDDSIFDQYMNLAKQQGFYDRAYKVLVENKPEETSYGHPGRWIKNAYLTSIKGDIVFRTFAVVCFSITTTLLIYEEAARWW